MFCWLSLANFLLQCLLFLVLVWYTVETYRLRRAAENQVEGLQKPCLSLLTDAREPADAILKLSGAVGCMTVAERGGDLVLHNLGNGPAINVHYQFNPISPQEGAKVTIRDGYLPAIAAGGTSIMPLSIHVLQNLEFKAVLTCESLTGQKYETRITIKNLVITGFDFQSLTV